MPREIPVGNGSLLVVFDDDYCLRDIYFPRVGKENQTDGRQCRWGVWAEGRFRWIGKEWGLHFEYIEESLVSRVTAADKDIGVGLICNDMVDYEENIYIKKVQVRNNADREREFRVFFHQDFNLQESSLANTAYYDPDEKALIHYKGKRYFLASGMRNNMQGIDQYATGVKEFRGLAGTWKDAEDGMLSGNAIAQGSVDSVLSFTVRIPARGAATVHYWICAGEDYDTVRRLNRMIRGHGLEHFSKRTVNYWRAWVNKENLDLAPLPPHLQKLFKRSLLILQTNIDAGGAVIAGNDSDAQRYSRDTYGYMWPRDGALSVHALARAGYQGIAGNFFRFCFEIVRSGKESLGGYFLHKYNPDGSLGSSWHPWVSGSDKILPVQEDSTALVLWSLWNYFDRYRDIGLVSRLYEQLILRCGDFLASYRDDVTGLPLPSYDLWEEKWGIHTFTVSAVYGGIKAAEAFARFFKDTRRERIYSRAAARVRDALAAYLYSGEHKRFLKSIVPREDGSFAIDRAVDASTCAPFYFGAVDPEDERMVQTMHAIRDRLQVRTAAGGIARYEGDTYYRVINDAASVPGNPWVICTLWLAQWHIAKAKRPGDLREAEALFEWAASHAGASGVLAEQLHPCSGAPLSVAPLTWSHATFVAAALEYIEKAKLLSSVKGIKEAADVKSG